MNETTDKHYLPYLSTVSTNELLKELASRDGVISACATSDEIWRLCVDTQPRSWNSKINYERYGPAKIIVVME